MIYSILTSSAILCSSEARSRISLNRDSRYQPPTLLHGSSSSSYNLMIFKCLASHFSLFSSWTLMSTNFWMTVKPISGGALVAALRVASKSLVEGRLTMSRGDGEVSFAPESMKSHSATPHLDAHVGSRGRFVNETCDDASCRCERMLAYSKDLKAQALSIAAMDWLFVRIPYRATSLTIGAAPASHSKMRSTR